MRPKLKNVLGPSSRSCWTGISMTRKPFWSARIEMKRNRSPWNESSATTSRRKARNGAVEVADVGLGEEAGCTR